ncbi:MAG: hypothetical protein LC754_07030 [Acidobacteria bacterium]|nr:hypothetical protein [Acidobacteriota bacterium]
MFTETIWKHSTDAPKRASSAPAIRIPATRDRRTSDQLALMQEFIAVMLCCWGALAISADRWIDANVQGKQGESQRKLVSP